MIPLGITLPTGLYRHYKGQHYRVLGTARHSETEELLVIYQALYGDYGLWARPASMFGELVVLANGVQQPRFELVQAEPTSFPPPQSVTP